MLCVVLKPFTYNREDFVRDQLEEGGKFRNVDVLLSQRYLRHATSDEIQNAYVADVDESESDPEPDPEPQRPTKTLKARLRARKAKRR